MEAIEDLDVITIAGIEVPCVIGIFPQERLEPQPVVVDVGLYLDTREAGDQEKLGASLDYSVVLEVITFMLEEGRFSLLETAAQGLTRALLLTSLPGSGVPRPELVRLTIRKPHALSRRGTPSLAVVREADEVKIEREPYDWGFSETIQETEAARFRRLSLAPGNTLALGGPGQQQVATVALTRGLLVDGAPVEAGAHVSRSEGQKTLWENAGDRWAALLLMEDPKDRPLLRAPRMAL